MRMTLISAAAAGAVAVTLLGSAAQAAPMGGVTAQPAPDQSLVETSGYSSYCTNWRVECARRWGWRTWRYRRCLGIHGCL